MPYLRRCTLALTALSLLAGAAPLAAVTPLGETFRLDDAGSCRESDPHLARLADGGFVAVWIQAVEPDEDPEAPLRVFARLFDADGTPRGSSFPADGQGAPRTAFTPVVAASGDGGFLIAWVSATFGSAGFTAHARAFTGDGTPIGGPIGLAEVRQPGDVHAAGTEGGYRVVWVWSEGSFGFLTTLTVDAATGQSTAGETPYGIATVPEGSPNFLVPRVAGDERGYSFALEERYGGSWGPPGPVVGAFRVARLTVPPFSAQRLDLSDSDDQPGGDVAPAIGTTAGGDTVVAWRRDTTVNRHRGLRARVFAADGTPRTAPLWLTGPDTWSYLSGPALTVADDGSIQAAWVGRPLGSTGDALYVASFDAAGRPLSAPRRLAAAPAAAFDLLRLGDGQLLVAWNEIVPTPGVPGLPPCDSSGILARRLSLDPSVVLPLHAARFQVQVDWRDPYSATERTGLGVAEPLNDESGWFWFFRPGNAELVVKVLDGRLVNGHWWVFHGGLSTVEYEITVTDTATDATWSYDKPPFTRVSAADTTAFPAAAGDTGSSTAATRPAGPATVVAGTHTDNFAGPCTNPSLPVPIRPGLCLHERFEVVVDLHPPLNDQGLGAAPLSPDTGRLWFFREDNTELLVKVLDGRPVNGRWWVFSGALTNVGYDLVVSDVESGTQRRYPVPQGEFRSIADTGAFADPEAAP